MARFQCLCLRSVVAFTAGFSLGQVYYAYLLKDIPFPCHVGFYGGLLLSVILGLGNAISIQVRCVSWLLVPMYCGKPGRGVLKAVVLIYVVAGPVTNMGLNAKEVVRVFACSTELAFNLSKTKYALRAGPLQTALLGLKSEIAELKDTFRSVQKVVDPIQHEVEDTSELQKIRFDNDYIDTLLGNSNRSKEIERKYSLRSNNALDYKYKYLKKTQYRCEHQRSQGVHYCMQAFTPVYSQCCEILPETEPDFFCSPLMLPHVCDFAYFDEDNSTCDSVKQVNPVPGKKYTYLKRIRNEFVNDTNYITIQRRISYERDVGDIQDAKETGKRVIHAFEEKNQIMRYVIAVVNVCLALLFLRIVFAAMNYHDMYLTHIEFDNIYVTSYFKKIDAKRLRKDKNTLLPLKKMERNKYVDVHSISYISFERGKLLSQILKVFLEMVTATTFVMLDRLFYEALDVVRQHAGMQSQQELGDMDIEVVGTGSVADMARSVLEALSRPRPARASNDCLPRPRAMPVVYYFKIYGGYLWILILLYINPYTLRLRRLICSYFYPLREKQRILHLYNDILKKRLKMTKTLQRKAVRTVRAHYLSGENLLSLRMRYPQVLGWLAILPMARMQCLICGDTEPRKGPVYLEGWYTCASSKCPFVYCAECWRDAGVRCLACAPCAALLSDLDSISEDEPPRY